MTPSNSSLRLDLADLDNIAFGNPTGIALQHKRAGGWYVWHWRNIADEVRRLAQGLRAIDFTVGDRLAVSGSITPQLLLISLAVRHLGGAIITVSPDADAEEIETLLSSNRPRCAFVQGRRRFADWMKIVEHADLDICVIFDHAITSARQLDDRSLSLSRLRNLGGANVDVVLGSVTEATTSIPVSPSHRRDVSVDLVWVEEDTRWENGPDTLLDQWLLNALTLVLPESLSSAARDRRQVEPGRLFASASRLQAIYDNIQHRLPPQGSWLKRLIDRPIRFGSISLRQLVAWLIRRPFGFRRLRQIVIFSDVAGNGSAEIPAAACRLFTSLSIFLASQNAIRTGSPAADGMVEPFRHPTGATVLPSPAQS